MGLSTFVGSFAQPISATGNQAITGVGFQPKLVLFWMNSKTADGSAANCQWAIGAAASSTARFYTAVSSLDNVASQVPVRRWTSTSCIGIVATGAATVLSEADLVTMDGDGFTVNWTTADASAHIVNFLAIGGSDITNVAINRFTSATGAVAVTTPGFKPDSVWIFGVDGTAAPPQLNQAACRANVGYSQGGAAATVWATGNVISGEIQKAADCQLGLGAAKTLEEEATFTSYDANGFTVNFSTNAAASIVFFVAIQGAQWAGGTFLEPASNTNVSVTGLSFVPAAVVLHSGNNVSGTGVNNGAKLSMGAASSTSARFCAHISSTDTTNPNSASQDLDRTKVLKTFTPGGGTPTLTGAADLASFNSDGFTTSWTGTDGTQREVMYLAVGPTGGGGGSLPPQMMMMGLGA